MWGRQSKSKDLLSFFAQSSEWIHGRCAGVKRVIAKSSRNFASRKREGNIGEAEEQEEKLCDDVAICGV